MADSLIVLALDAADTQLAAQFEGVDEWYVGHLDDHIYPTCPGLKRSGHPVRRGSGRLYPEAGDCCGWCVRVWRARKAKEEQ
ncbi:hypothetical protein ACQP2T_64010 (plasmid) [Nonomuraea sp. CA-143628]|uniref:hypothetical protein n=1 Tax=Nonomuraea sp. CA-143628 TaxID=3239997 RepID=UPI003D91BFAE